MTSQTKSTQYNVETASNNAGCGFMFLIASLLLIIVGFFISSTTAIICGVAGAIIGLVIMSRTKIVIEPAEKNYEPSENQIIQTTPAFNDIDQSYFDAIQYYGEKLYQFLETIIHDPNLKDELKRRVHFNEPNLSSSDLICTLMAADILKIYQQLDYKIAINKKESFAMIYMIARINNLKNITYANLPLFYDRILNVLSNYLPLLEQINADNTYPDIPFLLGALINNADDENGKQYHLLLYRYASLVAKADGTLSTKESDFLKSIMSCYNDKGNESEPKKNVCVETSEKKDGMSQLHELIGLKLVKNDVSTLVNFINIQHIRATKGLKAPSLSYHCVFTGNPGTGKTTVARILACIYKELGILKKGHLVETDRSGLVAEYVGQTAVKTNKIIDSAMDGVLFIDEAYSLVTNSTNDYGKEAIATLLKRMEDDRERLVVILAGYTKEMKEFIDSNPGLQSRFNRYIVFDDYSEDELLQIFLINLKKYEYATTDGAIEKMKQLINKAVINKDHNFGNGRWARNIFEKTLELQANRLATDKNISDEALTTITEDDIISEVN